MKRNLALAGAALFLGCITTTPLEQAGPTASNVINALKDELRYMNSYLLANRDKLTFPAAAVCHAQEAFSVTLKTAKIALKGVVSTENDPGIDAKLYVFSAGYTGDFSTAKTETVEFDFDGPGDTDTEKPDGGVNTHELTQAVFRALKALVDANHNLKPCFTNPKFSTTISFDVKNSQVLNGGVDFVIVSIGDKQTWSNERVQTIELDFQTKGVAAVR